MNKGLVSRTEWIQMKERGKLKQLILSPLWICFSIGMVVLLMISAITFYRFGPERLLEFYKYTFLSGEGLLYTILALSTVFIPLFLLAAFRWTYCVVKYKDQ